MSRKKPEFRGSTISFHGNIECAVGSRATVLKLFHQLTYGPRRNSGRQEFAGIGSNTAALIFLRKVADTAPLLATPQRCEGRDRKKNIKNSVRNGERENGVFKNTHGRSL